MDYILEKTHIVEPIAVDRYGRLLPSMALRYAQQIAGDHCEKLSLTYEQLAEKGLFWAVVRNRLQIRRMPTVGEQILLRTWPMPTTRTAYPRATEFLSLDGEVLLRSVSLWVLMDLNERTMCLPGKSDVVVEGTLLGTELASPRSLSPVTGGETSHRQVRFTDLDRNGHMNNARYLDWIWDLLPADHHRQHPVADMTLCYVNEALEGQDLTLRQVMNSEGEFLVDILREKEEDRDRIFSAKISFL